MTVSNPSLNSFCWNLSLNAQNQTPEPTTISIEEVGEVLARVNGEPLLTEALYPGAAADTKLNLYRLRSRIEAAIYSELVAQKAVALDLTRTPNIWISLRPWNSRLPGRKGVCSYNSTTDNRFRRSKRQ